MLGGFFKGVKESAAALKVSQVLQRNYRLTVPPHDIAEGLRRMAPSIGPDDSEHELAVWYLVDFANRMHRDHPKFKSEITKYIRVARKAEAGGFVSQWAVTNLCQQAHGLDFDPFAIPPGDP